MGELVPGPREEFPCEAAATNQGYLGGLGTGLGEVFTGRFPACSIGVQLVLPPGNRAAQPMSCATSSRCDNGRSTNFLVMQYQSFVAQARSTEAAAREVYAKARAAFERAPGATLENHNVAVK